MAQVTVKSVEMLPPYMCLLIDTPPGGQSCSTVDDSICIQCPIRGFYFTGEGNNDFSSGGHVICGMLWGMCVLVGAFGVLGNVLIITVLNKRSTSNKGFDFLLKTLALFDLVCCIVAVVTSSSHISYFGNWNGRGVTVYMCHYTWVALQFCRSATQYMTVCLTIERFLVITFPFQSISWFSVGKSRAMAVCGIIFAGLLSVPRLTSTYVDVNEYRQDKWDIPSLRDLDYYLKPTSLTKLWYQTLGSAHYQIDFWAPLPILLIFNFLSYLQVRKLSKKRKEMKLAQKQDIHAVKMFLPVVIVFICLNLVPISMFVMLRFFKLVYREVFFTTLLSVVLNSAVNFLIYYLKAGPFREETHAILAPVMGNIFGKFKGTGQYSPGMSNETFDKNESDVSSGLMGKREENFQLAGGHVSDMY